MNMTDIQREAEAQRLASQILLNAQSRGTVLVSAHVKAANEGRFFAPKLLQREWEAQRPEAA